jgi:hypothetical protein
MHGLNERDLSAPKRLLRNEHLQCLSKPGAILNPHAIECGLCGLDLGFLGGGVEMGGVTLAPGLSNGLEGGATGHIDLDAG